jgi:hypothetical protein
MRSEEMWKRALFIVAVGGFVSAHVMAVHMIDLSQQLRNPITVMGALIGD